jgi:hypothetical protein
MADGGNFILGRNNAADATTRLERGGIAGNDAVSVQNNNGFGISGTGTVTPTAPRGVGVYGFSRAAGNLTASAGVYGESTNGTGVVGDSQTEGFGVHGSSFGIGVRGESRANGSGVFGSSADGHGIFGNSTNQVGVEGRSINGRAGVLGSSPRNPGVRGESQDSFGVVGRSRRAIAEGGAFSGVMGVFEPEGLLAERPLGDGVIGRSISGRGVSGFSQDASGNPLPGFGVFGRADAIDSRGVVGFSNEGFAVAGTLATTPLPDGKERGWAGVFEGKVNVKGSVTVTGAKSAAVPHPDGSHRQLYALESPESWFEDFGRGEMVRGRAQVELDPDFAAVVQTEDYHVFLTPEGDSRGLYVSNRRTSGFEVREQQRGTSTLTFSYRMVARRADIEVERLEKVELPPPILHDARLSTPELPQLDEQLDEQPERPKDPNDTLVE